jgi:hypothetical protein
MTPDFVALARRRRCYCSAQPAIITQRDEFALLHGGYHIQPVTGCGIKREETYERRSAVRGKAT